MVNLGYAVNSVWIASLQRHKTFVTPWENIWMLPKEDLMLKRAFPPLHHLTGVRQVTQVMYFMTWGIRWHHWKRCYHKWVLLPKCPSDLCDAADLHPVPEDWMCYCIQDRVTLGEGGGNQPPPSHAWTSLLIANIFQDGLEEWITDAVILAPREVILFFRWQSFKEGLCLGDTRDIGFCLGGPVNWTGRETQMETMVRNVQ